MAFRLARSSSVGIHPCKLLGLCTPAGPARRGGDPEPWYHGSWIMAFRLARASSMGVSERLQVPPLRAHARTGSSRACWDNLRWRVICRRWARRHHWSMVVPVKVRRLEERRLGEKRLEEIIAFNENIGGELPDLGALNAAQRYAKRHADSAKCNYGNEKLHLGLVGIGWGANRHLVESIVRETGLLLLRDREDREQILYTSRCSIRSNSAGRPSVSGTDCRSTRASSIHGK
jgi:hypothetical protein